MERFTEQKFAECYAYYHPIVVNAITRRISIREESEDLAQDVFEHIWKIRDMVRPKTVGNLVYTAMQNIVTDYIRRHYRKVMMIDALAYEIKGGGRNAVDESYCYKELQVAHKKVVNSLPDRRRQVYFLYFYKGMSYASIADKLRVSERTVGGHLLRACKTVRTGLKEIYQYKIG